MRGDARAGSTATEAERHDHDLDIRRFEENLQGVRSNARNQVRLVGRVHVAVSMLPRQSFAVLNGLFELRAVKHDFGTHAAHGRDLARIGAFRHDDDNANIEQLPRIRDRLAVIARGSADQSAAAFGRSHLRNQVDAAAHFEGTDRLVVLVLYVNLRADQVVQRGIVEERRRTQIRGDALTCSEHIAECG